MTYGTYCLCPTSGPQQHVPTAASAASGSRVGAAPGKLTGPAHILNEVRAGRGVISGVMGHGFDDPITTRQILQKFAITRTDKHNTTGEYWLVPQSINGSMQE